MNFYFIGSFVSCNGSDDEKEYDFDFLKFDSPRPDGKYKTIIP
jgi:hypothetical protein